MYIFHVAVINVINLSSLLLHELRCVKVILYFFPFMLFYFTTVLNVTSLDYEYLKY